MAEDSVQQGLRKTPSCVLWVGCDLQNLALPSDAGVQAVGARCRRLAKDCNAGLRRPQRLAETLCSPERSFISQRKSFEGSQARGEARKLSG